MSSPMEKENMAQCSASATHLRRICEVVVHDLLPPGKASGVD